MHYLKCYIVRDISVAPLDCSDQTTILRMMDEEDGVVNRRGKKGNGSKKRHEARLLIQADSIDDLDL
uniref:Uncharacterized protein n=1 Tax=Phlebotomus papatasi TaxID=29031 RepID=A0A1B0D625_PHLPP